MKRSIPGGPAALLFVLACGGLARADPVTYVLPGSIWKYRPGTAEASSPDPAAWRSHGFDDAGWPSGPAPFGFGDGPYGTDLSLLDPPMRGNYVSLFLRHEFQVADASKVRSLEAGVDYDDGLVAWINGVEVLRVNVRGSPGDPVAFDGRAGGEHESGAFELVDLPDPALYLRDGVNLLAVQAFNSTLSSSDLAVDVQILDPEGPDRTAPAVAAAVPAPGSTIRTLERAEVTFSEDVTGVHARDLLVNGAPASAAAGSGRGPYVFTFPSPPGGVARFEWEADHGIRDLAVPPNVFEGGTWTVTFDPAAPPADLVLNEIVASNRSGLEDEDGETSDWIEIHNRGPSPVNLAGWSITSQRDEPGWVFPPRVIGAGEHLVVFASGKDRTSPAGNLHASFQLDAGGEYLALHGPETPRRAVAEIAPAFPEQRTDHSFGLDAAGRWSYFDAPTPGGPNGAALSFAGFVRDPEASVPGGLHGEPFTVELASDTPGAEIRYTLDGSEPDGSSELYAGPIGVAGSAGRAAVILRAVALKDGYLPSRVTGITYIFPDEVLRQPTSPPGFPATWGSFQVIAADYALDPLVVGDPDHAATVAEGLTAVPTLSLVMDVDDLFGPARGIYSNPSLEGPAWERAASVELIDPAGGDELRADCGVRIQGGSSTEGWKSLKLSMRLFFKEAHGQGKLEHRFFPDSHVDRFDTLILDAHLNLTWNHPGHDQRVRSQYVRDTFVSDLQNAMGSLAPHSRFVNLYLNGLYWGLYDVHERPDGTFAGAYLGGEKDEYDVLRHGGNELVDGSLAAWNAMMMAARQGVAENAKYESLQAHLDVRDLADYMIANIYAGNDDWPRHNWYAARRRKPGAGFRFFSWDAEHVLKDVNINQTAVSLSGSPAELYAHLRANAEFRLLFADRVHRHFMNGGPLFVDPGAAEWDPAHPERNRPAALYMRRIAEIDAAIAGESARWGDVRRPGEPYTRNAEWAAERDWLLTQYFPRRSAIVLNQLRSAGLYPALAAPSFNQHGGVIEPGFLLSMTRAVEAEGTIYFTLDGSDPREYGTGGVAAGARIYAGPIALHDRTHARARVHDGSAWSALNDALFTLDVPLQALRITEIMYNPPGGKDLEFIEIENGGEATLELGGAFFSAGIEFFFGTGTPIAPGEIIVLASNPEVFATAYPGVSVSGGFSGNLDNAGERVTLVDARGIAISSVGYDDERSWPIAADGFGHSLVLAVREGSPGHPSSWRSSAAPGGSPGTPDPEPLHGGVVVSEVLARAAPPLEDAVELLNPTGASIAIGGWYLSDQRDDAASLRKFRVPSGTVLPPGGRMVFYERDLDPSPGEAASFSIADAGGAVYLAAAGPGGNLTGYITGAELEGSDGDVSFARHSTPAGVDFTPAVFRTFGADAPSTLEEFRSGSGAPDAPPRVGPVVINELRYHPPPGEEEFIELHNLSGEVVPLHDAATGRGWRLAGVSSIEGTGDFEFGPGDAVPARGHALAVTGDPGAFRALHGVPAEVPIVGPLGGALDSGGERIRLLRPALLESGEVAYVLADQVRYDDEAPWPPEPDGGEVTLERRRAWEYGNDPGNWGASTVAGGTPGGPNSVSPPAGSNRPPVAYFTASPAAGPPPLAVRFDAGRSFDPDGSVGDFQWTFGDGGSAAGPAVEHAFSEAGAYAVTLRVMDGSGAQGAATLTVTALGSEPEPLFRPLDVNADGMLDGSDAIDLLGHLFLGLPEGLPCGDGTLNDPIHQGLFDGNGDSRVDVADALYLLNHLFTGGPGPVLGSLCLPARGCPDTCR